MKQVLNMEYADMTPVERRAARLTDAGLARRLTVVVRSPRVIPLAGRKALFAEAARRLMPEAA